jgi:L-ascorbate metabolism protein UlaG (beta-lactamase superfamily)
MDITWYGHACFRIKDRTATIVTDPYDKSIGLALPSLKADIVTVSHDHPGHSYVKAVKGDPFVINGPGEYELKDVFITGTRTFHDSRNGRDRGKNTVFLFEMEDLRVCHLGDIGHLPNQSQVEALGDISVLLIPVGSNASLKVSQAAEMISLLEPSIVVPMHYRIKGLAIKLDPVEKFLKELGLGSIEEQETLKVSKGSLPEETQVVLLSAKQGG